MSATLLAPILQLGRFGVVGGLATLVHAATYAAAIEAAAMRPLAANFLGFTIALGVSFAGHASWTFGAEVGGQRPSLLMFVKFVVVALAGLALNSLIVLVLVEGLGLDYRYAIAPMITVVPLFLFWQCKRFAFR